MKKLLVGITSGLSVVLLEGQMKYFRTKGYKTYLMCPYIERVTHYCEKEGCEHVNLNIVRDISLLRDIISFFQIILIFRKIKPDIINLGTPKVSLLGMIAGWILGIKNRIYTCRGFRFESESGIKRWLLIQMERITAACANEVICISPSLRDYAIKYRIFQPEKTIVIHKGSSNGFDLNRFSIKNVNSEELSELKHKFELNGHFVFGSVTRLIDRKGINELYSAFCSLKTKYENLVLMIVGNIEVDQLSDKSILERMKSDPSVILTGSRENIPQFLSLMDVFVLPAWWEGFGNVYLQAAAMGIPVIGTTATGAIDAIEEGFNGFKVAPKEVEPLKEVMEILYVDREVRVRLGKNGPEWAKNFDSMIIWEGMEEIYNKR